MPDTHGNDFENEDEEEKTRKKSNLMLGAKENLAADKIRCISLTQTNKRSSYSMFLLLRFKLVVFTIIIFLFKKLIGVTSLLHILSEWCFISPIILKVQLY